MNHPMQCAKCFRVCRLSDSGKTWVCTICKHREKANGGQAVSDTPRVDAATKAAIEHGTGDVWFVAMKLERELNAANDRIKRLEEAGQKVEDAAYSVQDWSGTALGDALDELNKAKEAKP